MAWFRCMGDISGLEATIASLRVQISNLNGQISQKDQTIADLNNQISSLKGARSFSIEGSGDGGGAGVKGAARCTAIIPNPNSRYRTVKIKNIRWDLSSHSKDGHVWIANAPLRLNEGEGNGVLSAGGVYVEAVRQPNVESGNIDISSYSNIYVYAICTYDSNSSGYGTFGAKINCDIDLS